MSRRTLLWLSLSAIVLVSALGFAVFIGVRYIIDRKPNLPKTITNSIDMDLVLIPGEEFLMGSPPTEPGHQVPYEEQKKVINDKPFYLSVHEVTQKEYEEITGTNPSLFKDENNPVERVTWEEALRFCRKLSEREGQTYRLPTSAEWEYACRARTTTPFNVGNTLTTGEANFNAQLQPYGSGKAKEELHGHPVPVGSYAPNAFGLYDMHGNVGEWCQDWFPTGGSYHVVRGGSWDSAVIVCRSASVSASLSVSDPNTGFRVVRTAEPDDKFQYWNDPPDQFVPHVLGRIDEALGKDPVPLKPGVIVLPLTDAAGASSSLMAMETICYGPHKRVDLSPHLVRQMYTVEKLGNRETYETSPTVLRRYLAAMDKTFYARPLMTPIKKNWTLSVEMHGDGRTYPDKTYTHEVTLAGYGTIPGLIALDVLQYLDVRLSPEEITRIKQPQVTRPEQLYYLNQWLYDPGDWSDEKAVAQFLNEHPSCIAGWESYLTRGIDHATAFANYENNRKDLTDLSDELKIAEANYLRESGRLRQALDLLLELAPTHHHDPYYFRELTYCGQRLAEPEIVDHLLARWEKEVPTYPGLMGRGEFLMDWAQQARGCGFADTVSEEGWKLYRQRQERARQQLEQAAAKNPTSPRPQVALINLARGLDLPLEDVNKYFAQAIAIDPQCGGAYQAKFTYLMPRWHGNPKELIQFGKQCAETGLWKENVPALFIDAVKDVAFDSEQGMYNREVFRDPLVWEGLKAYYEKSKGYSPLSEPDAYFHERLCSYFLLWGTFTGHYAELAEATKTMTWPDMAVIPDFITYYHILDQIKAETAPGPEQLLARLRLALASGDLREAGKLIGQAKDLPEKNKQEVQRYRRAIAFAEELKSKHRLVLKPQDLLDSWTVGGQGQWAIEDGKLVCNLPPHRNASLICPFHFGTAEIQGKIELSSGLHNVQVVVHAQTDKEAVYLRFRPQHMDTSVIRTSNRLAVGEMAPGPQSFHIRLGEQTDSFKVGEGLTLEVPAGPVLEGGMGFEGYAQNDPGQFMISNVEIRLLGKDAPP